MTSAQPPDDPRPEDPQPGETWTDGTGVVHSWIGGRWGIPKPGYTWVDEAGDLYTWNGKEWVPFEDFQGYGPVSTIREL
jgi:hypothetical protein